MMTALDTNVLLDVLGPKSDKSDASKHALRQARLAGGLCVSGVVCAEMAPHFDSAKQLEAYLAELSIRFIPDNTASAWLAGRAWLATRLPKCHVRK